MCILCVLIPVLTGLVCALLGYFLGRLLFRKSGEYKQLLADLEACRAKSAELSLALKNLQKEHADLKMSLLSPETLPFDADLAAKWMGVKFEENDLKIVEGIGPKIEELFHNAGIFTWKALSGLSTDTCREILDRGGEHFRIHDPGTWPKQCELACQRKWQELKEWQDSLKAGRL